MLLNKQESDLLVIGELNMDLILDNVESFPELEKEKLAGDMNLTLGSSSAIFASNIARLGINTAFCGMIGNDSYSKEIIRALQKFGINTTAIIKDKQRKTGLTVIIKQNNSRAMVTYPGAMAHFSLDHIPDSTFEKARHLHMSSIFLQPCIKNDLFKIIEKAKANEMTVSVDPQWDPEEKWDINVTRLLGMVDFFLPNEAEFLHLTSSHSVNDALQKLSKGNYGSVIVKQGIKGATFFSDGHIGTVPAFVNDRPVDAIGAGDSFNAGFICRFLRDDSLEQCISFGNLTGAVSTTQAGGTAAIIDMDAVIQIANDEFSTTKFNEITR